MTTVQVVETSVTVNNTPISVADPDLQIRGGPPSQKIFFSPSASFWSKIGGGGWDGSPAPPLDPPLYLELL